MTETPAYTAKAKPWPQILFVTVIVAVVGCFFGFHLNRFMTLQFLQEQEAAAQQAFAQAPLLTIAVFIAVYLAYTLLALPGISVLMIAGGAIFGLVVGTAVVAFSSATGATLSFLTSRYLFRDFIMKKWSARMEKIDAEMDRDGLLFLFTLRLIPVMPYFVVNLSMGLTRISATSFYVVTLAGMSITGFVYANAGTHLAELHKISDIWSPGLIGSFVTLASMPFAARGLVHLLRKARSKPS